MTTDCKTAASVACIRQYPDFQPVELGQGQVLEDLLRMEQPSTSEMSAANIFLWRRTYGFEISRFGDGVIVRGTDRTGDPFFLPPIGVSDKPDVVRQILDSVDGAEFRRVPEDMANSLREDGLFVEYDRDNSDYVYLASDLIDLPGRKYHRKKNHLAQFRNKYEFEYRRVTGKLISECVDLQVEWCDIRDCFIPENISLADEHVAIIDALNLLDELSLVAGAVLVDGRVAAFTIGGKLNPETLVIHFEKASPAYPGLYQVINHEFCADVAVDYRFVNREQDLGEPGLRKAKESYYPSHLVNKYNVRAAGLPGGESG